MTKTLTARPTIYNGVQMRSRLEAAWAEQFDTLGIRWEYEPVCVATKKGQYLPDFRLELPHQTADPIYFEVKGSYWRDPQWWGAGTDEDPSRMSEEWDDAVRTELARMYWGLADNVPMSLFILAVQSTDNRHVLGGYWQQGTERMGEQLGLCTCPFGCVAFTRERGSRCSIHRASPLRPAEPVLSLHGSIEGAIWGHADTLDTLLRHRSPT